MEIFSATETELLDTACNNSPIVFKADKSWQQSLLEVDELERLVQLIGLAIEDEFVCQLLLTGNPKFCVEWEISLNIQAWIEEIQATSIEEFSRAICEKRLSIQS